MEVTQTKTQSISLIGPMGAGKTSVGRIVAQRVGFDFLDSDQEIIDRTGVDISTIFDIEGESGFRSRERAIIDELTELRRIVLATGGGAVLDESNQRHLHDRTFVIYLCCPVEVQIERTRFSKTRPLLHVENPEQRLRELFEVRDPIYRQVAHAVVDAGSGGKQRLIRRILTLLEGEGIR